MATTTEPFRFLDLPTELRLMVYEYLPISTITKTVEAVSTGGVRGHVFLTSTKLQVAILATCKLIRKESEPIIGMAIRKSPAPELTHSFPFDIRRDRNVLSPVVGIVSSVKTFKKWLTLHPSDVHFAKDKLPLTLSDDMVPNSSLQGALLFFLEFKSFAQDRVAEIVSFIMYAAHHVQKTGQYLRIKLHWLGLSESIASRLLQPVNESLTGVYSEMTLEFLDRLPTSLTPHMVQNVEAVDETNEDDE